MGDKKKYFTQRHREKKYIAEKGEKYFSQRRREKNIFSREGEKIFLAKTQMSKDAKKISFKIF